MASRKKSTSSKAKLKEITVYDTTDTSSLISRSKKLSLESIGFSLPEVAPTQVVSIRLPSELLNRVRAAASQRDVPYQALIKLLLAESIEKLEAA